MAKQVFLLVESVYAEEGPGDGIRVLGTFTSKAGALSARRASLVKAQATELQWAHTWLARTQAALAAAPASKQAHDAYISAALHDRAWAAHD